MIRPDNIFHRTPVLVVGGVATRTYMPERHTRDIDFLVQAADFAHAKDELQAAGFTHARDLFFPNASLGLYGESWTGEDGEADILSSDQPWCAAAFAAEVHDETGARVIPLAFLVLMKIDSARGVDQGDLTRMLGPLNDAQIDDIVSIVQRYSSDPAASDDIRQYAALGRWELGNA